MPVIQSCEFTEAFQIFQQIHAGIMNGVTDPDNLMLKNVRSQYCQTLLATCLESNQKA